MTLKPVEDIYELWPQVRDGLEKCASKTAERYRPEDVYLMLQARTAWLYVFDDGSLLGFIVAQKQLDPDGPVLFIFALWGDLLRPVKDECYRLVEELARSMKAKRIRMQSPRKGWLRESFFKATTTVFEREILEELDHV